MNSIEKAMQKYFQSPNESEHLISHNEERVVDELDSDDQVLEKQLLNVSGNHANQESPKKYITKHIVKLDLARLNAEGIKISDSTRHQETEEYRNIKRPLLENAFGENSKGIDNGNLVMITSSISGEGKTFISINLALSIARELDRTVLLIDADPYKRSISRVFSAENRKGLTDILIDKSLRFFDVLVKTEIPKLTLLPVGQVHKNTTELMSSQAMRKLTDEMARRYNDRLILFDSPAVLETSESRVLSGLMGQILLIVAGESTIQSRVLETISHINSSKTIGVILNKSRQKQGRGLFF